MGVQRQSKHEYMARMQGRYLKAKKREKGALLDEVVEVTGYHRRHVVRVLRHGRFPDAKVAAAQGQPVVAPRRGGGRPRVYSSVVVGPLRVVAEASVRSPGCAARAWRPFCRSSSPRWRRRRPRVARSGKRWPPAAATRPATREGEGPPTMRATSRLSAAHAAEGGAHIRRRPSALALSPAPRSHLNQVNTSEGWMARSSAVPGTAGSLTSTPVLGCMTPTVTNASPRMT